MFLILKVNNKAIDGFVVVHLRSIVLLHSHDTVFSQLAFFLMVLFGINGLTFVCTFVSGNQSSTSFICLCVQLIQEKASPLSGDLQKNSKIKLVLRASTLIDDPPTGLPVEGWSRATWVGATGPQGRRVLLSLSQTFSLPPSRVRRDEAGHGRRCLSAPTSENETDPRLPLTEPLTFPVVLTMMVLGLAPSDSCT